MGWIITLFILVVGLSIGSFLNVITFRLGKKGGIFWGRSECPHCGHVLKWRDLIPVLSFLTLKGKCRHCRQKISLIYPAVEILTAVAFLAYIYFRNTYALEVLYGLALISGLMVIVFSDLLELIIPDKIVFPLIILAFTFNLSVADISARLITALILSAIFAIMYLGSRGRWLGLGDAKLVFLIGLALGYPLGVLAVLFSVWTAALVGIALVMAGKATLKTALPLGTFLAINSIIFLIFQNELQKVTQTIF
ncbi:MAG: prepilin peptidase [Candidatus Yanofskybacteria bacterium]|nr:prepilin peptidase [Candidatus Yanofskybacteria bacterium]